MTKFGPSQIVNKTPTWAKWMFGITLAATTAISLWVAGTNLIDDSVKYEAILVLKCIDPIIYSFSKMFGIEVSQKEVL